MCELFLPDGSVSDCAAQLATAVVCALALPFLAARIYRLNRKSAASDAATKLARLRPLAQLILSIFTLWQGPSTHPATRIITALTVASADVVQFMEVGRRRVSCPELLWFWLARSIIDAAPATTLPLRIGAIAAAVSSIAILLLEIWSNPAMPKGYADASIFGKIATKYLNRTLEAAQHGQIEPAEFAGRPPGLNSENACQHLETELAKIKPSSKYRVMLALLGTLRLKITAITFLSIASDMVTYTRPLILAKLLASLEAYRQGAPIVPSVYFAVMLAVTQLLSSALNSLYSLVSNTAFVSSRASLMGVIYRKALRLSPQSRETYDSAKIMNLLNVDTTMIQTIYSDIPTLVGAPLGLVVCVWQLYHFLGLSTIAAIPVYGFFIPYSGWHTKKMFKRFPESMAAKDARAKATWSLLRNIKSLKLYAWEAPYFDRVIDTRNDELGVQRKYLRLQSIMSSIYLMLDDLVATAIFICYLYFTGGSLNPAIVFPTLSLLSFVSEPLFAFPRAITSVGRALTSQTRINDFLNEPDQSSTYYYREPATAPSDFKTPTVVLKDASLAWTDEDAKDKVALSNVSMSLTRGDLCCVLGRVGAGKTALVRAICGQMSVFDGNITCHGRVAYCAQEPWLQFKTIRDNILFGLEYNEEVYNRVLDACQLRSDLEVLTEGDATEIGEKGIRLSGGQKARVALARAVYSRADIYVLDDILSAVDEHVSEHLIQDLLSSNGLLAGKTIILATNAVKVLAHASHVVILENKAVSLQGTPESITDLPALLERITGEAGDKATHVDFVHRRKILDPPGELVSTRFAPLSADVDPHLRQEQLETHVNVFSVFRRYLDSVGPLTALTAIIFLSLSTVFTNLTMVWLTIWSDKNLVGLSQSKYYVLVYVLLTLMTGVTVFLSIYWFIGTVAIKASRKLHMEMLHSVLRSPLSFFESTPLGSIMNRFTGDIATVDTTLPNMNYFFFRSLFNTIISFVIMLVGAPFVIVILVPLLYLYNYCRILYVPASRQLQRMTSAARSPILSHIEESIKGVHTVKTFDNIRRFIDIYEVRSDYWMEVVYMRASLRRWLNWRIDCMSAVTTLASAICMVGIVMYTSVLVGVVGIVLHSAQRGGMMLSRIIRSWTDLEVSAVAVERVLEYTDLIPEAREHGPEIPSEEWPQKGDLALKNYSTRYRDDLPLVLKNINVAIQNKQKIGVVGRTGSGKSTLTLAIFRIIEPSSGHIEIDGLNTQEIGLTDLRRNLSIIPQDAQIFKGTLRANLDPLGLVTDTRLWEILELCHLKAHFSASEGGLDTELSEGGENLSRGQAQLICLGRALLHESSILVLDEATASVDVATDQVVQQTIRSEFRNRTIITVAHRIDTILDNDKIIVMEQGEVVEFDSPENLMKAKGKFYALAQRASKTTD